MAGWRRLAALALGATMALAACSDAQVDAFLQPDLRQLVITIRNDSPRAAVIFVAGGIKPIGPAVGTVEPATVPSGETIAVRFGVPHDGPWAIFVNPGPDVGPVLLASDLPPERTDMWPQISITERGWPGVDWVLTAPTQIGY